MAGCYSKWLESCDSIDTGARGDLILAGMTLLHEAVEQKKYDVRLVERNIARGVITAQDAQQAGQELPDDAENAEYVSIDALMADQTGVIAKGLPSFDRLAAIAIGKADTETHMEQFLRAVGCNWLVCLAVWIALAATSVSGKILAIIFPITAFVAMGFDHVVANMFFLPAAMFTGAGDVPFTNVLLNLIYAFLGNAVGAGLFVAGAYWYLYGQSRPESAPAAEREPARAGRSAG